MANLSFTSSELVVGVKVQAGQSHSFAVKNGVTRVRLVGMFFDLNKCFLLPSAMHGIKEIKKQYDLHPNSNLLVVGHTDTSGKDDYNLSLSLERAEAVAAYLQDKVETWDVFFGDNKPAEKKWGIKEVQFMLSALPDGAAKKFLTEKDITGKEDTKTKEAVKAFQSSAGLKDDGIAGSKTHKALIQAYMNIDGTSLPQDANNTIKLTTHGCGENFPVDNAADGKRDADNRRVEIFFFDGPIVPAPAAKTSAKGSTDYPAWLKQVGHNIDIVLGEESGIAKLESRYALERFEIVASKMEEDVFVAWATLGYGSDIPLEAYHALYNDLKNKKLNPPEIQLVQGGVEGKDSAYDNATRMIGMREEIALAAEADDASAGELCALLMHEFGHHIDTLLRKHYSNVGGDAPGEEGGFFAYAIAGLNHVDDTGFNFATLTHDGKSVILALNYQEFHDLAKQYLSDPTQQDEAKKETLEFFGAGRGAKNVQNPGDSFGHQSIEDGLGDADKIFYQNNSGFRNRDEIYFGNWLRDYSQFLDPGWLVIFQNPYIKKGAKARQIMTDYLDLRAKSEFDKAATPSAHASGIFHVTLANCGVYRPEEHIDNPQGITDGSAIDPLFHGPVAPGEIDVDPNTGVKAYIATRGKGFVTAVDFVEKSLRAALAQGYNPEGRRLLGQALHTLEDLYAHSNFVELALIRLGHKNVHPWIGELARITVIRNGKPQIRIPMVTGNFALYDAGISGISAIGEGLEKDIECETGVFSPASVLAINLLKLLTEDGGGAIESLFTQAKKLEEKYPKFMTFMCHSTKPLMDKLRALVGATMRERVKEIGKFEREVLKNPNSTCPSHSMIAKDHDDNLLHSIAALCAKEAVRDVGTFMRDGWQGKNTPDQVVIEALKYFIHPDDIDDTLATGPAILLGMIKDFAKAKPAIIPLLDKAHSEARFLAEVHAEREKTLQEAREMYAFDEKNADRLVSLLKLA